MSRRVVKEAVEPVQACPVPEVDLAHVAEVLDRTGPRTSIITVLQDLQAIYGYLPEEVVDEVARRSGVSTAQMYGIITFYAQFTTERSGRYKVSVCEGTACHVAGAPLIIDALEDSMGIRCGCTSEDGEFTLEAVHCVGACAMAPVVRVNNEETHGRLRPDEARDLVDDLRAREEAEA